MRNVLKYCLIGSFLLCQSNTFANDWLKQWKKFSKLETINADFQQVKKLKELNLSLKTKGRLSLKVNDYFSWEIDSSKKLKYLFNDKGIHIFEDDKKIKSIEKSKLGNGPLKPIKTLKAWLRLDHQFINLNYTVQSLGKKTYKFIPKNSEEIFGSIIVESSKTLPIKSMILNEKSGDSMSFSFKNTKITYAKN